MLRTTKLRIAAVARSLLGLYLLESATTLHAVSPLVTDDADTVEPGKLQLNCDFFFVRTSSTSLYSVPINPVLGLTPRLELGVIFGYQWRDGAGAIPTVTDADDLTDLTVAPKLRLWQGLDDKLKFSARLDLKLPTASDRHFTWYWRSGCWTRRHRNLQVRKDKLRFQHWLLRDRHFVRRLPQ